MQSLPKISIITATYNQGNYIERCITSVLGQNYANLEYIVIDGGSSDQTADILRKYENILSFCLSEKDKGQSDALNKGFRKASGDIIYWLNSDDYLDDNVLMKVGETFANENIDMVMGEVTLIDTSGRIKEIQHNNLFSKLYLFQYWKPYFVPCQPGVFFHRRLLKRNYLVEEQLHYGMDHELWLHLLCSNEKVKIKMIKKNFAFYLFHEDSKSQNSNSFTSFIPEWKANTELYFDRLNLFQKFKLTALQNTYKTQGYLHWMKNRLKSKLAGS